MRATWGIRFLTLLIALVAVAIGGPAALILKLRDPARFQYLVDEGRALIAQGIERGKALLPKS